MILDLEGNRPKPVMRSWISTASLLVFGALYCVAVLIMDVRISGARTSVALFTQIFAAICAVLSAALWAQRRDRAEYGWLALLAAAWAVLVSIDSVPIQGGVIATTATGLGPLFVAGLSYAFLRCYFDQQSLTPRSRGWWLAVSLVAVLLVGVVGVERDAALVGARAAGLWLLAAVCAWAVNTGLRRPQPSQWTLVACFTLMIFALLDVGATIGLLPVVRPQVTIYAAGLFVGIFCWLLLSGFIDNLRHTEALNVELDQRVKEKTLQLTEQHQAVQQMQRAQVLAAERERIMRDMHDGVGGQLVSTLAMIEGKGCDTNTLREALGDALTDMRLMVDSLGPVNHDLNAVLATFRERMQPRLDGAGVELRWQVGPIPPVPSLGPSSVLSVLRIMQETVTNALKHAQADSITISTSILPDSGECVIKISDNGIGFDLAAVARGYGLANMRQRAADCGIAYQLQSGSGAGTVTTMSFATTGERRDHARSDRAMQGLSGTLPQGDS